MNTRTLAIFTLVFALALGACTPSNTATNNGGNQTVIVIEGDNSGDIKVQQGIVEDSSTNSTTAATEVPAATETTEAPAAVADPEVCYYFGWHDGWITEIERVHTNGTLNRNKLESGMSLQAPWPEWTSTTKVDGFTVPSAEELNNDALHGIACGDVAYMFGRTDASALPFWKVSYIQLTSNGLLACEDDVDTSNNGWSGNCSGDTVVVEGIPLDNVNVTDFQDDWDAFITLMESWDGPTPEFGTIEEAWTSKK